MQFLGVAVILYNAIYRQIGKHESFADKNESPKIAKKILIYGADLPLY